MHQIEAYFYRLGEFCGLAIVFIAAAGAGCGAPTADERMSDARDALASGEVNTANIHLRNLLQLEPDNAEARAMLAGISLSRGDFGSAEEAARRAIQSGSGGVDLRTTLLQSLSAQRKFEAVIAEAALAEEADGALNSLQLRILGGAQMALGQAEAAESTLRRAAALDPESPEVLTVLASIVLARGDADEARRLTAEVLRRDPDFVQGLILRGTMEVQGGRLERAEATFERAAELAAGEPRGSGYETARLRLVDLQLYRGDLDAADENINALLRVNPTSPIARLAKAKVEVEQGNLGSAEAHLQSLLVEVPQYGPALALLGAIDARQDQRGQAEMNLTASLTTGGGNLARLQLAEVYVRQGKVDEARRLFEGNNRIPQGDGAFLAIAGGASLAAGDTALAESYFAQSEQLSAGNAQDLSAVARIFIEAGEYDRAVRAIESATFEGPDAEFTPQYLTALVRLRQGQADVARDIAERLAAAQPSSAAPHTLLSMIAGSLQDLDAAREHLTTALSIEPRNVSSLLMMARLETQMGDRASAERRLREVVEIDGNQLAIQALAEIALNSGDTAAARSWLERTPESALKLANLGNIESLDGNFAAAADAYSQAYERQPTVTLATQYYQAAARVGRPNPEEKLLAWVARNPLDVQANFALGTAALTASDLDGAIERYEAVLEFAPDHTGALNNLAWIYSQRNDDRALEMGSEHMTRLPPLQRSRIPWVGSTTQEAIWPAPVRCSSRRRRAALASWRSSTIGAPCSRGRAPPRRRGRSWPRCWPVRPTSRAERTPKKYWRNWAIRDGPHSWCRLIPVAYAAFCCAGFCAGFLTRTRTLFYARDAVRNRLRGFSDRRVPGRSRERGRLRRYRCGEDRQAQQW
jgi:tetratricopeptide (TPR) repeat protein